MARCAKKKETGSPFRLPVSLAKDMLSNLLDGILPNGVV